MTMLKLMCGSILWFAIAATAQTFEPAGAIRLDHPRGEVSIEGWDQPRVEITITKSGKSAEHAVIKSDRRSDEIVISTEIPAHDRRDVHVVYSIKAPRDSKIVVDRADGGVYMLGMTGDTDASVRSGQITLSVPQAAAYRIEAQAKLGDVYSDFAGDHQRRHLFGHNFAGGGPSSSNSGRHKLHLHADCGDIVIMKEYGQASTSGS
jgi:hypothetical protein